jgi:hypothetical protein
VRIRNVGPDDVDLRNVHVHGYVVFGEAGVCGASIALVELRFFHESQPDPHSRTDLTGRAVAPLEPVMIDKRLSQWMQAVAGG